MSLKRLFYGHTPFRVVMAINYADFAAITTMGRVCLYQK